MNRGSQPQENHWRNDNQAALALCGRYQFSADELMFKSVSMVYTNVRIVFKSFRHFHRVIQAITVFRKFTHTAQHLSEPSSTSVMMIMVELTASKTRSHRTPRHPQQDEPASCQQQHIRWYVAHLRKVRITQ